MAESTNLPIRDILYIGGIILTGVVTFLSTRFGLRTYVRDKIDETENKIQTLSNDLEDKIQKSNIEIVRLQNRDELHQQFISQFQKQILDRLPEIYVAIEKAKKS